MPQVSSMAPRGAPTIISPSFTPRMLDNEQAALPDLVSSALDESDIIFGGEDALARAIRSVCERDVSTVFVLSTCIVATIGDDVEAVCGRGWPVPVIPVPTRRLSRGNVPGRGQ